MSKVDYSVYTKEDIVLSLIDADKGLQFRAGINEAGIREWSGLLKDEKDLEFNRIILFHDVESGIYWLADGFQRYASYKRAERKTIPARVYEGTRLDAERYSLGANAKNGNIRTRADKRKAVMAVLTDLPKWGNPGDTEVAELCAVSRNFVYTLRKDLNVINYDSNGDPQDDNVINYDHDDGNGNENVINYDQTPDSNGTASETITPDGKPSTNGVALKKEETIRDIPLEERKTLLSYCQDLGMKINFTMADQDTRISYKTLRGAIEATLPKKPVVVP